MILGPLKISHRGLKIVVTALIVYYTNQHLWSVLRSIFQLRKSTGYLGIAPACAGNGITVTVSQSPHHNCTMTVSVIILFRYKITCQGPASLASRRESITSKISGEWSSDQDCRLPITAGQHGPRISTASKRVAHLMLVGSLNISGTLVLLSRCLNVALVNVTRAPMTR